MEDKKPHFVYDPYIWSGPLFIALWHKKPDPFANNNYNHYKVWDEITYPSPNFNRKTGEVREWISNLIPYLTVHVITHPCWDWS